MKILPFHKGFAFFKQRFKKKESSASQADVSKKMFLNEVIMESLNESEREKEQILNSLVEQVSYIDPQYRIKWVNEACLKGLPADLSIEDILGKYCYEVWYNRKVPCEACPVITTLKTGWPWKEEISYADGSTKLVSSQPVKDDNGNLKGIIEIELDITMRKDAERALEKSEKRARALLDAIPDFLFVFNNSGIFIDYHPAADFDIITETANPEGKNLSEVMPSKLAETVIHHSKNLSAIGSSRNFIFNDDSVGSNIFYDCRLVKTNTDENICIIRDVSSQKMHEKDILYRSFHDSLTGLYNRAYFEEELNRIEQSREILPVSILVIDVNGLKLTNDAFGHDFGDKLLRSVASILDSNCRKSDVIARTGGDEFSIILPNSPLGKSEKLANRIIKACREYGYQEIFARPSVSIGCAEKINNSVSLSDVIKLADEKMYKSKLENKSAHHKAFIEDIIDSLKKRGIETDKHINNCMKLAEDFAKICNLSSASVELIKKLARVHDIGKVRLSERMLTKADKLTADEYENIKEHPIIGYRITKTIQDYADISPLVLYLRERWDGSGYPSGLNGKDIPLLSRIFAIIDSYDLMKNGSIYRKGSSKEKALSEIRTNSGTQFDPELVEKFIDFIESRDK